MTLVKNMLHMAAKEDKDLSSNYSNLRGGIPRHYRCMLPAKVKDFIYKVSVHMCSERLKRRIDLWLYNKNFDLKNFGNFLIKVL